MSKIHPAWDKKRKTGDRFDGILIKELDPMHVITPILYPNRCDNEAFFSIRLDITNLRRYINSKNNSDELVKSTIFHGIVYSIMKMLAIRPKLNRFVANKLMYQRKELTASFVVKKMFMDEGAEALAIINIDDNDTFDTVHEKLAAQITSSRSEKVDKSSENMDIVSRMPRRITRLFCEIICFLDKIGHCPKGLIDTDPYYTSVVFTNLGSLGLPSGYHHLTNWGTTSIFVIVGKIEKKEVQTEDGSREEREFLNIGITLDERLADGYYYAKTVDLLKYLVENPKLFDRPIKEDVQVPK